MSDAPMLHVGQPVICVQQEWWSPNPSVIENNLRPVCGRRYHIRAVFRCSLGIGVLLSEVVNQSPEVKFDERAFRPLADDELDISAFTDALNKINKREVVDA